MTTTRAQIIRRIIEEQYDDYPQPKKQHTLAKLATGAALGAGGTLLYGRHVIKAHAAYQKHQDTIDAAKEAIKGRVNI